MMTELSIGSTNSESNNSEQLGQTERPKSAHEQMLAGETVNVSLAEEEALRQPSAERYLTLSLALWQAGRYHECIAAANKALGLKPRYALAYNNISAAYRMLGEWDKAINAARQALQITPNYTLAKQNLGWAIEGKAKHS